MPFYEYECSACKYYVEALQKVSDEPMKKCPSCGKETLQRLISAPVFRLKGAGWYETDFKSDKENKRNLADDKQGDTEPVAKTEEDDKQPKLRASKALKKVVVKKTGKKAPGKVSKPKASKPKTSKPTKPAAKSAQKPVKRPVKKPVKRAAKKAPAKKKVVAKKAANKAGKKAVKKSVARSAARKK
jgi:putative FmdB family regulatory protein